MNPRKGYEGAYLTYHRAIPYPPLVQLPLLQCQLPIPPILPHTERCNDPYHNDDDSPDSHHRVSALHNDPNVLEGIEHGDDGERKNDNNYHIGESVVGY
jgi:hypothetical protein